MRRVSVDIGGTFTDCFVAWGDRESTWEMDAGPRHHNPTGVVQGGILCSIADVAMATAFAST